MEYVIVGLGNPGEEYENTRHNVGRMVAELLHDKISASDWRDDKKSRAKISQGVLFGNDVKIILPDNYMNNSGGSVSRFVKSKKQAERMIVVHDDIDLPVGSLKVVFNRGAGGHRGVESVEHVLKTRAFIRVRVGVVPKTLSGKLRKPKGKEKVHNFILKNLSKKDREEIDNAVKKAVSAIESIVGNGYLKAMNEHNIKK